MTTALPQRIGSHHRVQRLLARGGMGSVYEVIDERSAERLALKLMHDEGARLQALFEREYRTLLGMHHPRIVEVHEYGLDARRPYYTMELLDGSDLHALAPLDHKLACSYLRDVASALSLLHTRGFVHRDLTARNVRTAGAGHCKLIDFGAIATFGVQPRIVGTPHCIAPEALRGAPLDQRTDLFALGTLAYWLLTAQHAYPARSLEQLPQLWAVRPDRPSRLTPDRGIPRALDELVLQLLALEPQARPASTAEVIEQLTTIAQLPPEDASTHMAIVRSYFATPEFVGRGAERGELQQALARAAGGEGACWLLCGDAGAGRSRLLAELVIQARQRGAVALEVDAGAHPQLRGAAIELLNAALDSSPGAREVAVAHADVLSRVDASVARRLSLRPAPPEALVSGAWRARLQEAMQSVILSASESGPLLIALDDVDEADEASLALFVVLAHAAPRSKLLLVCTCRNEAPSGAASALLARSQRATVMPLTAAELHALARSLFGEAPLLGRFAAWLHEASAGRPLLALELVKQLFDQGEVRYLDGLWVLPTERPAHLSAEDLDAVFAQRVAALDPAARAFAELLAIQRGALTRERCAELGKRSGVDGPGLLETLTRAGVLLDQAPGYRFAQRAIPRALRAQLATERARRLHALSASCALALASESEQLPARIEAGFHLLEAGQDSEGADLLADVTYDHAGVRVAFADVGFVAPALEAALAVYTRQGRSVYERMPLVAALAQAGYYESYRFAERHGSEALAAVEHVLHIPLARRLRALLGANAALACALLVAYARFRRQHGHHARYGFRDALSQFFSVVTTLTGVAGIQLDTERAEAIIRSLEPFSALPERLTPVGVWEFCSAMAQIGRERRASEADTCWRLFERFGSDRWYVSLGARERMLYRAGLLYSVGALECFRDRGGALRAADELDQLDLALYHMIAAQLRALHHAFRGERRLMQRYREQVEVHAVRVGSAWQVEIWEPAALLLVQLATGDLVECKRLADRLEAHLRIAPSLARHAQLAGLIVRSCRPDELPAVVEELRAMLQREEPRGFVGWGATQGLLAQCLNRLGRHAEARQCSEQALAHVHEQDRELVALFLGLEIEHARALSGLGEHAPAARELDALLARHARSDNPLTLGRLHEARAQLAEAAHEPGVQAEHTRAARPHFAATEAPALIKRSQTLESALSRLSRLPPANQQLPALPVSVEAPVHAELEQLVRQLLHATRSARCAVYEARAARLELLAFAGARPSVALAQAVETRIAELVALGAADDDANTASTTALSTASSTSAIVDDCAIYLLLDDHAQAPGVIGAVTVDVSAVTVAPPCRSVLREVAARLREPPPALAREG